MFHNHSNNWTILDRPKNCENIQSCFQEEKPKNVSKTPKNDSETTKIIVETPKTMILKKILHEYPNCIKTLSVRTLRAEI